MSASRTRRLTAAALTLLVVAGPVTDVLGQRGGRSGGGRSRSTAGSSVRTTRSAQTSQPPRATPSAETAQGDRARQQPSAQTSSRTSQGDEPTVIEGERGTAVVGEQGMVAAGERGAMAAGEQGMVAAGERGAIAVGENAAAGVSDDGAFAVNRETGQGMAVGEEGFAIASDGEIYGGDLEGGVIWYEESDWYVYEDVEAWQVAAGVAVGIAIGTVFASPPASYTTIYVAEAPYYYYDYMFYAPVMQGTTVVYQVIPAPVGAVVPGLPAECTTRSVGGTTHWICSSSAYVRVPTGYQVVVMP